MKDLQSHHQAGLDSWQEANIEDLRLLHENAARLITKEDHGPLLLSLIVI